MASHDVILEQIEVYKAANEKFAGGTKSAAAKARKALGEIAKAAKERRKEILAEKGPAAPKAPAPAAE